MTVASDERKLVYIMPCHACGAELLAGKQFCHSCGEAVKPTCASCGNTLDGDFRFCPDCGAPVDAPPAVPSRPSAAADDSAAADGAAAEPAVAATDSELRRFSQAMPAGMAEKVSAAGPSASGERKVVTVLFCDLAGSTAVAERLDPEDYREILDQYLEIAFREIYRFEGIVNQLAGDGLMALFGAPISHEDDPRRALWAALAIRDAMADFNDQLTVERGIELPARIGVNTGPVVVGAVGNDLKMDYTAIGDTTNVAARLESEAAPGSILISEETERLVRGFFRTRAAGALDIKGKSEPLAAFEVVDAVDASNPIAVAARRGLTPLVGREEELAQMLGCFDRLEGELPQVIEVLADAGSGKSRLIHEFREQLTARGVTFFEARCSALHQLEPYFPFINMLRSYFSFKAGMSEEEAEDCVSRKIGMDAEAIEREFPHLSRLLSETGLNSKDVPADELQQETTRALGNLVMRESQKAPVVAIFEDLHWADDQSRELLELAVAGLTRAPVMVVVSSRPNEVYLWRTKAALTRMYLRPLSDRAMDEIMRSIVGGSLPDDVTARVRERAEGSPFFVEEITRSLLERGLVDCGPDGCKVRGDFDDVVIPGSVREIIAARLDSLDPQAKRVAQLGAILGRQFRRGDVGELLGQAVSSIAAALTQLVDRGVIHVVNGSGAEEHRFGESLTQEVAYESLLLRERRELHERIGEMLQARGSRPTLVAHHFARSSNDAKAIETLLVAAEEAEKIPAFNSATDLYRKAWDVAESYVGQGPPEARERLLTAVLGYCRMVVLYGSSEDPVARRGAELAIDLAGELEDLSRQALAKTFLGMMLTSHPNEFDRGLATVEEGFESARKIGDESLAISLSRGLAWNYMLDGRFDRADLTLGWAIERQLEIDGPMSSSEVYLSARMMQQQVRYFADQLTPAMEQTLGTIELSAAASNRTVEASSLGHAGHIEFLRGHYEEARRWAKEAFAKSEAIGIDWGISRSAILLLATEAEIEGEITDPRILQLAEEAISMGGNMVLSVLPLVEALVGLLKFRRAESLAREALAHSAGRLRLMYARAALGDATLRLGEDYWAESEDCFRRSLALSDEIGSSVGKAVGLNGLGKLAFVRGQHDAAIANFTHAVEVSRAAELGRYERRASRMLEEAKAAANASKTAVPA